MQLNHEYVHSSHEPVLSLIQNSPGVQPINKIIYRKIYLFGNSTKLLNTQNQISHHFNTIFHVEKFVVFFSGTGGSTPVRRFNVTVVSGGPSIQEGSAGSVSPVPRHRGQPFASIPEDHALDDNLSPNTTLIQGSLSSSSRCASPAPSWDFSLEDSDSVSFF